MISLVHPDIPAADSAGKFKSSAMSSQLVTIIGAVARDGSGRRSASVASGEAGQLGSNVWVTGVDEVNLGGVYKRAKDHLPVDRLRAGL
jgi:hypothetical protein